MTDRRLYLGPLTDNRRWDSIELRSDDVIVVTPPKSGTTWMQTIVALLFSGDPEIDTQLSQKMPWVDIRFRPIAEVSARINAMPQRRCLKSHTPLDGLPLEGTAQYIAVFRHPLDAHFSYRAHLRNTPLTFFDHLYPDPDPQRVTFRHFLDGGAEGGPEGFDGDAMPLAHILRHYRTALALAAHPNVTLFHYSDMCRDLAGTFARVCDLLDITLPRARLVPLIEAARFENMRANAERFAPAAGSGFFKSDRDFFHSGSSGKWHGQLTPDEVQAYGAMMDAHLSPQDRAWLEYGAAGG